MDGADDFVVPYRVVHERMGDDEDTEQHKALRGETLSKRSIKHYRHATSKWGAALEGFSPLWFAICISSGGLALILNAPFPYRGHWQVTITTILYILEIVLFVLFMVLMIARWIIYPHTAIRRAAYDPGELGAYAIPPIALMTLASLTISQVDEGSWGGHGFTIVAYVLWWVGLFWVFVTTLVVLSVLFYNGNQADRTLSPVIFMAPVGLATAGAEAGFISIYSCCMSARLAVPQVIVGYFAVGIALFVATMLYTMYMHRLLSSGWPSAAQRPSMFILIGPCGQLSTALQLLGDSAAAYKNFAEYKPGAVHPPTSGTFWTQETAVGLQGSGLLLALLLLGFGYFWFAFAFVGVTEALVRKRSPYSLIWWSLVFPTVTLTTAWLELADAMDSPTFRALTCAMTVFITIAYFANWGFTLHGIIYGSLLFGPTQEQLEDDFMKKAMKENGNGQKPEV